MKHTKGPWELRYEYDNVYFDDERIYIVAGTEDTRVATVPPSNEALDDARLIAAAPELLEALEKVQSFIADWRDGKVQDMYLEELKYVVVDDAIAKAKGG